MRSFTFPVRKNSLNSLNEIENYFDSPIGPPPTGPPPTIPLKNPRRIKTKKQLRGVREKSVNTEIQDFLKILEEEKGKGKDDQLEDVMKVVEVFDSPDRSDSPTVRRLF